MSLLTNIQYRTFILLSISILLLIILFKYCFTIDAGEIKSRHMIWTKHAKIFILFWFSILPFIRTIIKF